MNGYEIFSYGDAIADIYDDLTEGRLGDPREAAATLAEIAGKGKALELGVGTGRVAIPLREAGVEVHGIDSSEAMLERLHARPGGSEILAVKGDFADVGVAGSFALIYVTFNTFLMLFTADDQMRCIANVSDHLEPGGAFVVEAMVLDQTLYDRGQRIHVHDILQEGVWFEAARYDATEQRITSQNVILTTTGIRLFPARLRMVSPSELDLMARLAGLQLESRWSGWRQEPFTARSGSHVSVYRKSPLW